MAWNLNFNGGTKLKDFWQIVKENFSYLKNESEKVSSELNSQSDKIKSVVEDITSDFVTISTEAPVSAKLKRIGGTVYILYVEFGAGYSDTYPGPLMISSSVAPDTYMYYRINVPHTDYVSDLVLDSEGRLLVINGHAYLPQNSLSLTWIKS